MDKNILNHIFTYESLKKDFQEELAKQNPNEKVLIQLVHWDQHFANMLKRF